MDNLAIRARFWVVAAAWMVLWLLPAPHLLATTVNTGLDSFFPVGAPVVGATPTTPGLNAQLLTNSMEQTFQIASEMDLWRFYVISSLAGAPGKTVDFSIYRVADTNSATTAVTPLPEDLLLTSAFTVPGTVDGRVVEVILDEALTLPATVGTAGYALRLFGDATFPWQRTGASAGSVYAGGAAYNNNTLITGSRDFAFALSSDAPPPPPAIVTSVASGNLSAAGTWSDNQVPHTGSVYHIQSGHTVTANTTAFAGEGVVVTSGGTLNLAVNASNIPSYEIQSGATLTGSVGGDFAIGNINLPTLATMVLNADANFAASAGADLFLDVTLTGTGSFNFAGNGAGSDLVLTSAAGHGGTIRFHGSGDEVQLFENRAFGTLEMNSTGANRLRWETNAQVQGGTVIFNQPGEILHSAPLNRLQGPIVVVANAPVTIDVSATFATDERRFFISGDIQGSQNITVIGTPNDPTSGTLTHNEFELRGSDETGAPIAPSAYSGTIVAQQYIDLEIRRELPSARIELNANSRLEMGYRNINATHEFRIGEVEVKNGATLVVGYEEVNALGATHVPQGLHLTKEGGRQGSLTLASGSRTMLQISGTGPNDFDRVLADGNIVLGGTLEILVNPVLPTETDTVSMGPYVPLLGDSFDIFKIASTSPTGDYDGSGTVGPEDYLTWKAAYGAGVGSPADGNGDGTVDAADYTVWRNNLGAMGGTTGTISGAFLPTLVVTDPGGAMSAAGLQFQLVSTATLVRLTVVAAGSGGLAQAVPEPGAVTLLIIALLGASLSRWSRLDRTSKLNRV